MAKFVFKEAESGLWPPFEKLFGENGACGGCWCQFWRFPKGGKAWEFARGEYAKTVMKSLFDVNEITGLIAFDNKKAIGWCSYGPRSVFSRIQNMKAFERDDTDGVWCINCFFIDRKYRGKGLSKQMLTAALEFMSKRGVRSVEAYPVPLTKAGKRLPASFVFSGPLKIFLDSGFEIIQRKSYSRPLVRKNL